MSAQANMNCAKGDVPISSAQIDSPARVGSGSNAQDYEESKLKDVTSINTTVEAPPLSVRPVSPPPPRSVSQLKEEIKVWSQDSERTTLVLNQVSRGDFRPLREVLRLYDRSSLLWRSIKAMYLSQQQRLELRKTLMLQSNASDQMAHMFLDEIKYTDSRVLKGVRKGVEWVAQFSFDGSAAFACPKGEADNEETRDFFTYLQPEGCVRLRDTLRKELRDIYDTVLPPLVVLVGINSKDQEIVQNVERWLRERKGLSTEVNALINVNIRIESDTCLEIELSVYGRPTHFNTHVPLNTPDLALDSPYHLYSQSKWRQGLDMTPVVPSLSLPPSVFWGIGKCPKGFPDHEMINISATELENFSGDLMETHRQRVALRDGWVHPDI